MKRADTMSSAIPVTIESKLKIRKELDDMAVLKYHICQGKLDKEYHLTNTVLGKGSYATVKLAESVNNPDDKVAVKIYEKGKLYANKHRRKNLCNEIMVLKNLNHRNILRLIKVYEDRTNVYLVMEYAKGLSLFKYLKDKKSSGLNEQESKFIFREILSAILYGHQKSIAHRDIKLENIIVTNDLGDVTNANLPATGIKLIDFGFALKYDKNDKSTTYGGTPSYMAPEIVKRVEFNYEK